MYLHRGRLPVASAGRAALLAATIVLTILAGVALATPSRQTQHQAVARAALAGAVGTKGPDVLGGVTADGWPVVFRLSANGRMLTLAAIGVNMNCTSGAHYSTQDGWMKAPVTAHGRVALLGSTPLHTFADGSSLSESDVVVGAVTSKRDRLSGTWDVHDSWIAADGTRDSCDSGPVRFTARA
jgi:hypothetical protein